MAMYPEKPQSTARRWKIAGVVAAVVVVVGLALGLGLYYGLKDDGSSGSGAITQTTSTTSVPSSSFSSSSQVPTTASSTTVSTATPTSSTSTPTASTSSSSFSSTASSTATVTATSSATATSTSVPYRTIGPVPQCGPNAVVKQYENFTFYCDEAGYQRGANSGTQDYTFSGSRCMAKADVPDAVVAAALKYVYPITPNLGDGNPCRWHDLCERNGEWVKADAHWKSAALFQSYYEETLGNCEARGYVNSSGLWQPDDSYPSIAVMGTKTGPMVFPTVTEINVPDELCAVGETCCLPELLDQNSNDKTWLDFGIDLQKACAPKILQNCTGYSSCANVYGDQAESTCNCWECDNWTTQMNTTCDYLQEFSGAGGNCWELLPEANMYYNREDNDLFFNLAYVWQQIYKATGVCVDSWDSSPKNTDPGPKTQLCERKTKDSCKISFVPFMQSDYTDYDYLGHP
eukprot:Nk52_evm14s241 gene=Nk52_evmTU14s241